MTGSPNLRPTRPEDLPAISDLTEAVFGRRRSPELLDWLLLSGEAGGVRESRVAEADGRIVGHVGRIKSRYAWRGRVVSGGHPILWMLSPQARGQIGVQQGHWCTEHGDLSLVLGGTPASRPIMERRGFIDAGVATEVRLPAGDARSGGEIRLEAGEPVAAPAPGADGPVVNLAEAERLCWLAACPELEARLLRARRGDELLGPVLLYLNRGPETTTGRIVHLPWSSGAGPALLDAALAELARAGCTTASVLTTSAEQLETAVARGGEPFYERPIYFRNQAGLTDPRRWHLTYLEGDLGYRGV